MCIHSPTRPPTDSHSSTHKHRGIYNVKTSKTLQSEDNLDNPKMLLINTKNVDVVQGTCCGCLIGLYT